MARYKEELNFCKNIAKGASDILIKSQNNIKIVDQKDNQDIATNADMASEKFIIGQILKTYPSHGIKSEEQGEINSGAKFTWLIDPLDGTKEYVRRMPLWNCSIALQHENETVVSVVNIPYEDVMYSAALGMGSFRNDINIHVSDIKILSNSFIYCYLPSYKRQGDRYDWGFNKLKMVGKKAYRLRSHANVNSALCWLAQGGIEAYLNLTNPPKDHDIKPGLLIAKEAGAYNATNQTPLLLANNKDIYNQVIDIIKT